MKKLTNMSRVIHRLLFNANLTKAEATEVFRELGSGDDTVLAEQILDITKRQNEYNNNVEQRMAELEQAYDNNLVYHGKQYAEKLLAIDHAIATMVASRNVALKRAADGDELNAVYEMYDSNIYKTKLSRQELSDNFKQMKNVLYREWQEKKRALVAEQRESKLTFEIERIQARRAYHDHKNAIIEKWLLVVNDREVAKGGAA